MPGRAVSRYRRACSGCCSLARQAMCHGGEMSVHLRLLSRSVATARQQRQRPAGVLQGGSKVAAVHVHLCVCRSSRVMRLWSA